MSIANKIFIISKSYINIFGHIKSEIPSGIKIIQSAGIFKTFIITVPRYSLPFRNPSLHIHWISFLVIGKISGKSNFVGNSSTNSNASCIQKKCLIIICFF